MKYPKNNTLWKRDKDNNFNIIEGDYSCEEFKSITRWEVTEKIDGTNIRVYFNPVDKSISFEGRTNKAIIPEFLLESLKELFDVDKMSEVFAESKEVILYGEGYGDKIQGVGSKYRKDTSFILFDVIVENWWLDRENVIDIADKLNIKRVPSLGIMTTEQIISLVKSNPYSIVSEEPLISEGVVVRSHPLMFFRSGKPIMWKLKTNDYLELEKKQNDVKKRFI